MNTEIRNSIIASLQFDFRGQTFTPSIEVNLDQFMLRQHGIHELYDMLGASIGLDSYRHEYDVMVLQDICFSEPVGLVSAFVEAGRLDFKGFNNAWQESEIMKIIRPVALKHLAITDLDQHPDIRNALMESYRSGQVAGKDKPRVVDGF